MNYKECQDSAAVKKKEKSSVLGMVYPKQLYLRSAWRKWRKNSLTVETPTFQYTISIEVGVVCLPILEGRTELG